MRKLVAPVLCSVLVSGLFLAGCRVTVKGGEDTPKPSATPAPTPTPTPAPTPAPTPTTPPTLKKPGGLSGGLRATGNKLDLPSRVNFETGTAKIDAPSEEVLKLVVQYLRDNPDVTMMRVEGHTDSDDDANKNMALSAARAMSVTVFLTGQGVDCKKLVPVGFGETKPLKDDKGGTDEAAKAENRRVDFIILAKNNKALDPKAPLDGGGKISGNPCAK